MQTLERRVSALEQASPASEGMTIIHRIVSPGHLDAEIYGLRADDGQQWTRQTGETEQLLIDRASKETKRNSWGFARLITDNTQGLPC